MISIPEWMRQCAGCVPIVEMIEAEARGQAPDLREYHEARMHLAESHRSLLPDYHPECGNCAEWQALFSGPEPLSEYVEAAMQYEALLHRAGHLLYNQPSIAAPTASA